jgi:hypothetical protein
MARLDKILVVFENQLDFAIRDGTVPDEVDDGVWYRNLKIRATA